MEILITAAVIAVAIFPGLAKVAKAMREPRPIDPAALVALEEKIAEATARADSLGALTLQLQQTAIETRESLEEMTTTLDREDVEGIVSDWMECDFCLDDHFDKDQFRCDLEDEIENKIENIDYIEGVVVELEEYPAMRPKLRKAISED